MKLKYFVCLTAQNLLNLVSQALAKCGLSEINNIFPEKDSRHFYMTLE